MEDNMYNLWANIEVFIPQKDKEEALFTFLQEIYENDICEISDILHIAEDSGDDFVVDVINKNKSEFSIEDYD